MNWSSRFQSHPQYGQAMQFATGRPRWVLRATGMVAVVVFIVPLIVLALMLIVGALITAVAWVSFSMIARMIDAIAGPSQPQSPSAPPAEDGRENVRVIQRP